MKFLIYAVGIWVVFTVFTTVYAVSARKEDVRTLAKGVWVAICLLVPIVGGLLYLTLGRPLPTPDEYAGQGRNVKTVAPDDDPDFLRRLSERLNPSEAADAAAEDNDDDEMDKPRGGDLPSV
ncbi:MAG: hypothetical protein RL719_648 [Actinomycetota bacterium]